MADAQASGACGSNTVWVQVPSPALKKGSSPLEGCFSFYTSILEKKGVEYKHCDNEYCTARGDRQWIKVSGAGL